MSKLEELNALPDNEKGAAAYAAGKAVAEALSLELQGEPTLLAEADKWYTEQVHERAALVEFVALSSSEGAQMAVMLDPKFASTVKMLVMTFAQYGYIAGRRVGSGSEVAALVGSGDSE